MSNSSIRSTFVLFMPFVITLASPTHLVMMVLDDVGWADVGYHGSDFPTPSIDRLATTEGVRLENYYVQQVCSPTRSALMTGRYPFHIGMQHVTTLLPGTTAAIPMDVPTIAEVLKKAGYRTHLIGKWHLGYAAWKNTPRGRGFDSSLGYLQGACDYYNKTNGLGTGPFQLPSVVKSATTGFDFWRNSTAMWEEAATASEPGPYSVNAYQREAKRILDNHDPQQPLFLYFAHQNVHDPLQYPPEPKYADNCRHVPHTHLTNFSLDRHTFCAMMNRLDDAIGEFVGMLSAKGMWNNTLMWVTTDNGGMLPPGAGGGGVAGSVSSNYPLRSGKTTLFQGGVRGASFVTGGFLPKSARNTVVTGLLQHVDVPATFIALAGAAFSSTDGFNVWNTVAHGADSPRIEVPLNVDTSFLTKVSGAIAGKCCGGYGEFNGLIRGRWKLISGWSGPYDGWSSIDPYRVTLPNVTQNFQIVGGSKVWLFDIQSDPEERENLAAANPLRVRAMQMRLWVLGRSKHGYVAPQTNLPHARSSPMLNNGTWAPFLRDDESEVERSIAENVLI